MRAPRRAGFSVARAGLSRSALNDPVHNQCFNFLKIDEPHAHKQVRAIDRSLMHRLLSLTEGLKVDLDSALCADDE
jgi:hypothetical protein